MCYRSRVVRVSAAIVLGLAVGASADSFLLNTVDLGGFPGGVGSSITTSAGFYYQNTSGNNFPPSSGAITIIPSLEFDSYVAIDSLGATDLMYSAAPPGITPPGFNAVSGFFAVPGVLQGGWGTIPGTLSGHSSSPDGRDGVFIARLTILKGHQLVGKSVVVDINGVAPGASSGVFDLALQQVTLGGPEYEAVAYKRQTVNLSIVAGGVETGAVAAFDVYDVYIVRNSPPCPGDTNQDGVVDFSDLNAVLANWGTSGPEGDIFPHPGGNGIVNFADLNLVLSAFEMPCP